MIDYPADAAIQAQARRHGLPEPVLVRDLVRIVEVLNLDRQGFFSKDSVLAGSMALRCFGSPRFTVYDADFSTSETASPRPEEMRRMLAYEDDDLTITPAPMTPHDARGTAWKSEPITYVPIFTALAPDRDRQFKADVSFRGLVCDGLERRLLVPYDLGIWEEDPAIWIMDPHEVVAEKVLGWCVNRLVKHYADLAFIGMAAKAGAIDLEPEKLRSTLAAKLEQMRQLQPERYAAHPSIDSLIGDLAREPALEQRQWQQIVYLRDQRPTFTPPTIARVVKELLVPLLRSPRR